MAARGEAVIGEGKSLRRAPTHSSLLSSPITVLPRAAIMIFFNLFLVNYCEYCITVQDFSSNFAPIYLNFLKSLTFMTLCIYIQGVMEILAHAKEGGRLAQIKKEGLVLFCDMRNN